MHVGDGEGFEQPEFDDSDWEPIAFGDVPGSDSILWLRGELTLMPEHLTPTRPLGLHISALASHEIWWDGQLIGRGGQVGASAETEVPGPIHTHYVVPDRLAQPGPHKLALRTSAFHRGFEPSSGYWVVWVAEYDQIARAGNRQIERALIGLSGLVVVAIFSMILFLIDRRDRSFLFLALLCATAGALLIAESWRMLFGYTYDWHLTRLIAVTALAWLFDLLLLVFLARRFPLPRALWFVLAGVLLATIPVLTERSWDPKALLGFLGVFSLALAWTGWAVVRRLPGSLLAFLGVASLLGTLLWNRFGFIEYNLYLALDLLLLCLLASHALQVRRERQEREQALLKSARLELELLRRHIQPHFLMNTLTALAEWVEEEPAVASRMIQALAEEFRLLGEISSRRLIRLEDEIRLCRTHLEIMSYRKGHDFRMTVAELDLDSLVPPAVIHTLVENAITHNHYDEPEVEMRLTGNVDGGRTRYRFEAPLGREEESPREPRPEGTGLRYIRARLTENFGQDWQLTSRCAGTSWVTEIQIPQATGG